MYLYHWPIILLCKHYMGISMSTKPTWLASLVLTAISDSLIEVVFGLNGDSHMMQFWKPLYNYGEQLGVSMYVGGVNHNDIPNYEIMWNPPDLQWIEKSNCTVVLVDNPMWVGSNEDDDWSTAPIECLKNRDASKCVYDQSTVLTSPDIGWMRSLLAEHPELRDRVEMADKQEDRPAEGRPDALRVIAVVAAARVPRTLNVIRMRSIGNLKSLTFLYLYDNNISGTIPDTLGNIAVLKYLSLWGNQLSGTIPSSIGNLKSLTFLYLFDNNISGTIPDTLGNIALLEDLRLRGNQLSGTIPSSIGNLTSLTILYLNENRISGTIPDTLGNLVLLNDL
eukprot:m51a1_g11541 putative probable lrr receptor-like serine threonine-protein kinase at4g08850-like (336) ;mRNA; r:8363-12629